jgi:hypothetical protein
MIRSVFLLLALTQLFLSGCGDDDFGDVRILNGTIDGIAWEFKYAKANQQPFGNSMVIELYGLQETASDPCGISSTNPYVSITLPRSEDTYFLPLANGTDNLKFHKQGSNNQFVSATSGFVEITGISGRRVTGYMQALFDDQNQVEGSFAFDLCF